MNVEIKVRKRTEIERIDNSNNNFKKVYNYHKNKYQKLGTWLEKESDFFLKECREHNIQNIYPNFKRGQIIKVDFGINLGTELSYTHFAIVLNADDNKYCDNLTVLPITSKDGYRKIPLGKLLKEFLPNSKKYNLECYGHLTQITTISKKRILKNKYKYICNNQILDKIDKSILEFLTKK